MLDTLNVARYIINYSNQEKYGISNLRLQKLLCNDINYADIVVIFTVYERGIVPISSFEDNVIIFDHDLANVERCSLLFFIGNKYGNHMSVFSLEAGANSNSIALYQCWTYALSITSATRLTVRYFIRIHLRFLFEQYRRNDSICFGVSFGQRVSIRPKRCV